MAGLLTVFAASFAKILLARSQILLLLPLGLILAGRRVGCPRVFAGRDLGAFIFHRSFVAAVLARAIPAVLLLSGHGPLQ